MHRVLLIEDEQVADPERVCHRLTREFGFECKREPWNADTLQNVSMVGSGLVVFAGATESTLPASVFRRLRKEPIGSPTLAILPSNCDSDFLSLASEAMDDFIISPVRVQELQCRVARIVGPPLQDEESSVHQRLKQEMGLAQLVGNDRAFLQLIRDIPGIAASPAPVLLQGETGTGKELCAQAIHSLSPWHAGPFIPVECGAIPETLLENELFGHVSGAFTGAQFNQKGLVAMAEGGTLFLDEVDSLPQAAQAKLLRLIQEGTYRSLGAQTFRRTNIRLIAATNRDLEECVREKHFRADLYFRLNVLPLRLPPLRERRGDIIVLAGHFLKSLHKDPDHAERNLSRAALRALQSYDWPGNVRELYNVLQRAVTFSHESLILPTHLGLPATVSTGRVAEDDFRCGRSSAIAHFEKAYLVKMLSQNHGNVTRAARAAGKDRRVFGRLMKRYGIDRREYE